VTPICAIWEIRGADLPAIWEIFDRLARDKRLYMRDAGRGWLRLPRGRLHPVKLKPAAGLV
jgi:hypothetical protein